MDILLILIVGALNIVCFFVGAKVGQKTAKGEDINVPTIKTPIEIIKERNDKKEAERKLDRIETIMSNIENYDGTSNGQRDIPKG